MFFSKKTKTNNSPRSRSVPRNSEVRQNFVTYHANRQSQTSNNESSRRKLEPVERTGRSRIELQHVPMILLSAVLILGALYTTVLTPEVGMRPSNSKALLRDQEVYKRTASTILKSSIGNRNKITINSTDFEQQMKSSFPELQDIALTVPLIGKRPILGLTAEQPAFFFSSSKGIYLIGESGRVLANTSEIPGASRFDIPTIKDSSNLEFKVGKGVIPSQDVTFITTISKQLASKNLTINSITLPARAEALDVTLNGSAYTIKFNLLTDPRIAVGQYLAVKAKLERENVPINEYIDVRVEEKVFYK